MDGFNKKIAYNIVLYVLAIIVAVELCIMLFFEYLNINGYPLLIAIIDPLMLSIISAPIIYILIIKPYIIKNTLLNISVVQTAVTIVESHDPYTSGHMKRVANLSMLIAMKLNLPAKMVENIFYSGLIHDLGKIHIPAEILIYPGKLEKEAFALIMTHSKAGFDILKENDLPWPLAEVALQHHERLDGSGYPNGLKGNEILIEAQIVAIADVFDAIISQRPYRSAGTPEDALELLIAEKGIKFNDNAVKACVELVRSGEYDGFSEEHHNSI